MKKIEIFVSGDIDQSITSAVYDAVDMINKGVKSAKVTGPDFKLDFAVYELIELKTEDTLDA